MKNLFFKSALVLGIAGISLTACRNDDVIKEDDLPQEEMSNVLLNVKDVASGTVTTYDYQVNGTNQPTIKVQNGKTYDVEVLFKNGDENVNTEIIEAKDEHFLVYNFPNSDITLTRTDDDASTRTDGAHVGLKTRWVVNKAANNNNAELILTLYHEPKTVSEVSAPSGTGKVFGQQSGGETDAQAVYKISN